MTSGVARFLTSVLLSLVVSTAVASELTPETALHTLKNHCGDCHSGAKSKGQFDLARLSVDFSDSKTIKQWDRILTRVEAGEMPPPDEQRPPLAETKAMLDWAKNSLEKELQSRRANTSRTRMRRLNRLEYENTLHDLLGIRTPLRELLPQDVFANGFDTATSALSISPYHIQQYMAASDRALNADLVHGPQPEKKIRRFYFDPKSEAQFIEHPITKPMIRLRDGELIFFAEPHFALPAVLTQFSKLTQTQPGRYRVRVSSYTHDGKNTSLTFAVRTERHRKLLGYFDAPPEKAAVVEVEDEFQAGDSVLIAPYHLNQARGDQGLSQFPPRVWTEPTGIGLAIQWIEVEGPLNDAWPTQEQRRLFSDVALKRFSELPADIISPGKLQQLRSRDALTVVSSNAPADAQRLLSQFLSRAFRRPVTGEDIQPYLDIALNRIKKQECFESAMLAAYQAALCSPKFLFLIENRGPLNDHSLATRLSYLLWRSMPDDTLRAVADRGELRNPEVLRRETERLLASPRSQAFVHDFLDHWLQLRDIDATTPDQLLFPECFESSDYGTPDSLLRDSMLSETRLFFADLLKSDGNLLQIVDSDYTYLNNRLAAHYGLPPVQGSAMRRVALPADSVRGGLMTQASVLKVTANGLQTSPVLRGAWLLNNILGRHPPPPPANVGVIEPDTRGATNIREQLAKHQNNATCAACHSQIDPPGFAMECFDPSGQWRTFYRTTENGKILDTKFRDGSRKVLVRYMQGVNVDPSGRAASGEKFAGPKEFKKMVLSYPDLVARNLAAKLVTYGTGQSTEPGDIKALDAIVERTKAKNYGLRSLIHEVVQSELFLKK